MGTVPLLNKQVCTINGVKFAAVVHDERKTFILRKDEARLLGDLRGLLFESPRMRGVVGSAKEIADGLCVQYSVREQTR